MNQWTSRLTPRTGLFLSWTLLIATVTHAETVATVNDVEIDSSVLNLYIESRLQKPAAQATPEERNALLDELTDIYLLTTQPRADELADSTRVKAQAELQYRGLLAQATAADYIERNPATEEEVLTMYREQIESAPDLQYRARHILVESQGQAESLIDELEGGAEFAALAEEHSTDGTASRGGDLGWFSRDQMVEPFADAVVALENGEFTKEPVQTQFGWHVILREGARDNEPPTLDSVRDSLRQRIQQQRLQNYMEGLRADYEAS